MMDGMGAGMLGIDPETIKQLIAAAQQMGPSEADKAAAKNMGLLQFGLSALANVRKPTLMGLGEAGTQAVGSYQNELTRLGQQRAQALQSAQGLFGMANSLRNTQMGIDAYKQWIASKGGAPGAAPPQAGPLGGMSNALSAVGGPASDIYSAANQAAAPPGAPPPAAGGGLSQRDALGGLALAQGIGKGDVTPALNFLFKDPISMRANAGYMDPTTNTFHPGMSAPPGYTFNPQTQKLTKIEGAPEAFASQAGAVTGAQSEATSQHDLIPVPLGDGTTQMMTRADAVSFLQSKKPTPGNVSVNLQNATPTEVAAMARDIAASSKSPLAAGLGRTANPVALKTAEAEGGKRGEELANFENSVHAAAHVSSMNEGNLARMNQLLTQFTPGATLPTRSSIANYALDLPGVGETAANMLVPNAKTALPAIAAFNKLVVGMTADQSKVFGSREGQQVIGMVKNAQPNIGLVPGAPETIMEYLSGINKYNSATEQALASWKGNHGGSVAGFEEAWHQVAPVTSFVPPLSKLQDIIDAKPPGVTEAKAGKPEAAVPPGKLMPANSDQLKSALEAIKKGADPAAVKARMIERGISPAGL